MDAASNRTSYTYDDAGRRIAVTDALTNTTQTAYDAEGRVLATWGATYPVAYEYDDFGRMTAMFTLRDSSLVISNYSSFINHRLSFDKTTWQYDLVAGLLTNKVYADGKGTTYAYTQDGKLSRRTWARGVTTTYCYDGVGQMTNINYSGSTPDVSFTFNRLGQQVTIADGQGTRTFTYNATLQLASELVPAVGTPWTNELVRVYDAYGRPAGFSISSPISNNQYQISYSYDPVGRFHQVDADVPAASLPVQTFQYTYLPGSDLIHSLRETNTSFSVTRTYEPNRNLITQILNTAGTNSVSQFDYANDAVGRRTLRVGRRRDRVIVNLPPKPLDS